MELIVRGAQVTFFSDAGRFAFRLDLPEIKFRVGAINYIMGHNGSGKSVFLKLLNGELNSTDAPVEIVYENKKYSPKEIDASLVRQRTEENLCLDLSVEENIIIRLSPMSMNEKLFPKKYLKRKVFTSLRSQILLQKNQVCSELSGGQKQSLAFVSATAKKAKLLCLDEFLSSTDYITSMFLRKDIKNYAIENNACVIVVSHDFEVALEDADRIFILKNGTLLKQIEKGDPLWNKVDLIQLAY